MVIGASSSDAIALATANRSPDGSPPSDSGSACAPTSPSASTERSISPRWPHGAPRLRPSTATPDSSAAARTSSVSGTGARSTSPAALLAAELAQQRGDLVRRRATPTPRTSACGGSTGWSSGSWITTPPISPGWSGSPWTRSSRVAPRSSRTRPRLARGRGLAAGCTVRRYGVGPAVHSSSDTKPGLGLVGPTILRGSATPCRW